MEVAAESNASMIQEGGSLPEASSETAVVETQGAAQDDDATDAWKNVKEDPNRMRPRNMFDVTATTYEQYVDRHYAIMLHKHREMLMQQQQQWQMQQMQQMQMQQQQQQQHFGGRGWA